MQKRFYTTSEVAELCSVTPVTIFRAIVNQQLKAATTPGGHFRISRDDLEIFLHRNNIPIPEATPGLKRILIVEDNPLERRLLERILRKDNEYALKSTGQGYQAGFLTQSFKPHILILDIFLHDIDGRQIIKLIREEDRLSQTKIIVITGAKDPADLKEIKALEPDAFFQKPISSDQLRQKVKELTR